MKNSFKIIVGLVILLVGTIVCGLLNLNPLEGIAVMSAGLPIIASMKSSTELGEEKRAIWEKAKAIIVTAKESETRAMTEEQTTEYDGYLTRMGEIDLQIKRAKEHERLVAEEVGKTFDRKKANERNQNPELKSYNMMSAIRSAVLGKPLEGVEKDMHEEAEREMRAIGQEVQGIGVPSVIMQGAEQRADHVAGTDASGGYGVPTELKGFIEPLKAKMVLAGLGAQYLTGLTGNVDIPAGGATSVAWEGETDAGAETLSTHSKLSLTPNRLGAYADFSKQLLIQSSIGVQSFVQNEILSRIALAVEAAGINGAGASNVPEGILQTTGIGAVAGGTNGAAPTWADIINLEREVAIDNADMGSLGYLTNPQVKAKLKATALDSGSGLFVWPQSANDLNGFKAAVTTQVPSTLTKGNSDVCSAIIFGNFADLLIGQWGGMDIVVDPYTQAPSGLVRLVINSWWDVLVKRAASFAAMQDALTA